MSEEQPIVIIKKKGGHAGHHGGAWKVAYSDFITSMMCFFLVMWLVTTTSSETKKGIADYFKNPGAFTTTRYGNPLAIGAAGLLQDEGYQPRAKTGKEFDSLQDAKLETEGEIDPDALIGEGKDAGKIAKAKRTQEEIQELLGKISKKIKEKINKKLNAIKNAMEKLGEGKGLSKKEKIKVAKKLKEFLGDVQISVDATGINIEIIDTEKVSMFEIGSAKIEDDAKEALTALAVALKDLPNNFEIIGHTDSSPFLNREDYSNWELSADRANATRRVLQEAGIDASKITSVSGKADKELKDKDDPYSYKNRRITLRMSFANEKLLDVANNFSKFEDIEINEDDEDDEMYDEDKVQKTEKGTYILPDGDAPLGDIFDIPVAPDVSF